MPSGNPPFRSMMFPSRNLHVCGISQLAMLDVFKRAEEANSLHFVVIVGDEQRADFRFESCHYVIGLHPFHSKAERHFIICYMGLSENRVYSQ